MEMIKLLVSRAATVAYKSYNITALDHAIRTEKMLLLSSRW
jgi:hypothetical protein